MKKFLLVLLLLVPITIFAGPPENTRTIMMPLQMMCTPSFSDMISSLTKDFAVHISSTFQVNETLKIFMIKNPNTKVAGILAVTENNTCVVFSGKFLQNFERPPNMAPPELNMDGTPYKEVLL